MHVHDNVCALLLMALLPPQSAQLILIDLPELFFSLKVLNGDAVVQFQVTSSDAVRLDPSRLHEHWAARGAEIAGAITVRPAGACA